MKQDVNVGKFLNISAQKLPKAPPYGKAQCEVVAVAPDAKPKAKDDAKPGLVLHKDFKDFRPLLDRLNASSEFSPKAGSACLARFNGVRGADHVLVVGTGVDKDGINQLGSVERLRRLGATVAHKLIGEKVKQAVVYLDTFLVPSGKLSVDAATAAYAFAEGFGLAAYRFDKYFSKTKVATKEANADKEHKKESPFSLTLASSEAGRVNGFAKGVEQANAMLLGAYTCRDLSNEPSNELHPTDFADRAKRYAETFGLKATVLDEKQIIKENMGLLAGVGQGSIRPPRLIMLEYTPKKAKTAKTIAFVGKGITFDSGGISIKPSARMEDMKHDMSGAAAVVGAIVAASQLKLGVRIVTIVAAAENMPGGNAICPGNILNSRAGKTVEITNTDAEGRLVLADALDYAQDLKPDYIIDLATLTGAVSVTLGKSCSGLMGNDAGFNKMVSAAAKDSGERVWELPLYEEYFDDLKSEYADMRNSGDTPSHGTAKGAMFLKQFIRKGTRWVHLDIASVAWGMGFIPYNPKKASSGYGVRLLVELAKKI
ncbi:MAG: leucyl aminopeptidase [Deltaproteobacteria bacterium]|nr:leucyl aminopeptidase [Deltaproteobacteria bacterium]